MPVIAAVHGVAFGGGFQLALGADLRYVAPGTRFSIIEAKWGLVPDMAGTQLMRHLAREDIVRALHRDPRLRTVPDARIIRSLALLVDEGVLYEAERGHVRLTFVPSQP